MRQSIYLEISRKGPFLEISLSKGEQTLTHYEESSVAPEELGKRCNELMHLLNLVSRRGTIPSSVIEEMQQMGRVLYNEIFPLSIKSQLYESASSDMILRVDNTLVHVPWELLFDGQHFLCEKFNIGRMVKTQQIVDKRRQARPKLPLRILIIADPKSDLKASYEEGQRIRDELRNEDARVTLVTSEVSKDFIKKRLFNYDLIHYAGHADYDLKNPSQSGWLVEDGKFTTLDIRKMGGSNPLPWMVFSNACQSGQTEEWSVDEEGEEKIYGLANAFLLSGVQHYIGTFWKVLDEPSTNFALKFYENLLKGASVGESMRSARLALRERYGEENILWASYLLYGDPGVRYFVSQLEEEEEECLLAGAGAGTHQAATSKHQEVYIQKNGLRTRSASGENGAYGWRYKNGEKKGPCISKIFSGKRVLWGGIFLFIFLLLFGALNRAIRRDPQPLQSIVQTAGAEEQEFEKLKGLVKTGQASDDQMTDFFQRLVKRYYEQNPNAQGENDLWTSKSIALFFVMRKGSGEDEEMVRANARADLLMHKLIAHLENSPRVVILEREFLDTLLQELDLGSSPLSAPEHKLALGRLVAGTLFTTCSVSNFEDMWHLNLRIVESETSRVEAALSETWKEGEDLEPVAARLAEKIIDEIDNTFPLQGKITQYYSDKRIMLNIGSRLGVEKGMKFDIWDTREILGSEGEPVAKEDYRAAILQVSGVSEDFCYAEVMNRTEDIYAGMRVSLVKDVTT